MLFYFFIMLFTMNYLGVGFISLLIFFVNIRVTRNSQLIISGVSVVKASYWREFYVKAQYLFFWPFLLIKFLFSKNIIKN